MSKKSTLGYGAKRAADGESAAARSGGEWACEGEANAAASSLRRGPYPLSGRHISKACVKESGRLERQIGWYRRIRLVP